jgi:hypothetical protein
MKTASEDKSRVEADHCRSLDSLTASAMSNKTTRPPEASSFHANLRELLEAEQMGSGIAGDLWRPISHQPRKKISIVIPFYFEIVERLLNI